MKSSPLPRRRSPLARGGPIKKKKRSAKEFTRIYGGLARLHFVKGLPCIVCGNASTGPCDSAHVVNGGMGRKADAKYVVPLCSPHHQSLHRRGVATFEARYNVDLRAAAVMTEAKWIAHSVKVDVANDVRKP